MLSPFSPWLKKRTANKFCHAQQSRLYRAGLCRVVFAVRHSQIDGKRFAVCIWGFTVVHGQPAISSSDTILLNLLT
jgi:hypothetical protein